MIHAFAFFAMTHESKLCYTYCEEVQAVDMKKKYETNGRYLSKFKSISIRVPLDRWTALQDAASQAGKSASGYILDAVLEKMDKTTAK